MPAAPSFRCRPELHEPETERAQFEARHPPARLSRLPDPDDEGPSTETLRREWLSLHHAAARGIPELARPAQRALNPLINRDPQAAQLLATLAPLPAMNCADDLAGPSEPLRTELRHQAISAARTFKQAKLLDDFVLAKRLRETVLTPGTPSSSMDSDADEDEHLRAFFDQYEGIEHEYDALLQGTFEALSDLPYTPNGADFIIAQEAFHQARRERIPLTYQALGIWRQWLTQRTSPPPLISHPPSPHAPAMTFSTKPSPQCATPTPLSWPPGWTLRAASRHLHFPRIRRRHQRAVNALRL
ncbi:hypothetical protein ACH4VR_29800 [Streptomyces sp. NPDC020883]|uniref:hypothetical protein n=1 Tax=Streptomyces sp. NPDC020883 TaxID=3365099 RepID=UPI0037879FD2